MSILVGSLNENSARTALVSEGRAHGVTYGQLDDCSGRIYSWLKSHGFGREDFILICLPRGIRTVVSMIGVLKAGAAYTVVENTYSPDRIEFIKKDCGCSLVIDEVMFLEMMRADFLGGYETTDPHDAAFVIYTSGTTGNPKGAVHEYGQLDKLYVSHIYSVHRDHDGVGMKRDAYENLIDLGTDGAESPIVSTLGLNGFFALSIALATASLNNYRKQSVFCVFNGRSSAISANIFGLLFKAPPVYFDFEKGRSVGEVVEKARESISEANAYSFYPFYNLGGMNDDGTAILFQNGIYGLGKMEELVEESIELGITDAADAVCDFEIIEDGKDFRCLVNYSADIFEYDSIDRLFKTFCKAAKFLIEYGPKPNAPIDELIRTLSE